MEKNNINVLMLLLIPGIFSVLIVEGTPPVGCEQIPDFLHCWNQGTIAADTYFNISSGFIQHANTIDRADDAVYVFGYARKTGSTYTYVGLTSLPSNLKNGTDNTSYYWLSSGYTAGQHTFMKNSTQNLNDNYVGMKFSYKSTNAILGNSYFVTGIRQLDINNDKQSEKIILSLGNGSVEEWDNRTGTQEWSNITRIVIDGGEGTYSYDLYFSKGAILVYNHTSASTNGDLTFLDYIGTVGANISYNYSYQWIDAVCTWSCPFGCGVIGDANFTGFATDEYTQGTPFINAGCRVLQTGMCIGRCTISADCTLYWGQNTSSSYSTISTADRDRPLKCSSSSCAKTSNGIPTWYYRNLSASKIGSTLYTCGIQGGSGVSTQWGADLELFIRRGDPQTTIWTPPNNTVLNATVSWAVFGVNNTGNITADNITLLFNNTANYTSGPNLSKNVSFDITACWIFTARACYSHNCPYSTSGNFTICMVAPLVVPGTNVTIYFRPKSKDDFRQFSPEDKTVLAILGAILLLGSLTYVWKRKEAGRGEGVEGYSREIRK